MRLAILAVSMLCLGILVMLGLLHLVRELLLEEFFHPPSMPGETPQAGHGSAPQPSSQRAKPAA